MSSTTALAVRGGSILPSICLLAWLPGAEPAAPGLPCAPTWRRQAPADLAPLEAELDSVGERLTRAEQAVQNLSVSVEALSSGPVCPLEGPPPKAASAAVARPPPAVGDELKECGPSRPWA
ncbi:unnamed protein product [Prorocentrum cordatum]|uniref:Uncharacterized protein n=1 Tax=Prorocentrum cordatum TaxID=2364126 RepID=A0ABN9SZH6_9DINO|nr:unnamed protein product [Polarella glacialis]